jgi:hypothetical protein
MVDSPLFLSLDEQLAAGARLAVIKAPPGSGKTYMLLQLARQALTRTNRVAIAAPTNAQADDICRRLSSGGDGLPVVRFASKTTLTSTLGPGVLWLTSGNDLPASPCIVVGTVAKWGLSNLPAPFDVLFIDEAWQMAWSDFMLTGQVSDRFVLIGDPGQIPPVVSIAVKRWETSPRAPHLPAPELILHDPGITKIAEGIETCRRLPYDAVELVQPFYDFEFQALAAPGERYVKVNGGSGAAHALDPALEALGESSFSVVTLRTDPEGPPFEVDPQVAGAAAEVVGRLLDRGATVADGESDESLQPTDIGVVATHRVMNGAIQDALGRLRSLVRVETPERWQGLERKVMVVVHPLSGNSAPTGFDLHTGRLCVMASRHRSGLVLLSRDHLTRTLEEYNPSADQAVGRPDATGRGHADHLTFWNRIEADGRVRALSA